WRGSGGSLRSHEPVVGGGGAGHGTHPNTSPRQSWTAALAHQPSFRNGTELREWIDESALYDLHGIEV
ncbi:MAG: hypothetical protein QOD31_1126, partial [Pseudonocardiales bacterium]|nr:hypothetical protein [Pseudonocardiales bacterium]